MTRGHSFRSDARAYGITVFCVLAAVSWAAADVVPPTLNGNLSDFKDLVDEINTTGVRACAIHQCDIYTTGAPAGPDGFQDEPITPGATPQSRYMHSPINVGDFYLIYVPDSSGSIADGDDSWLALGINIANGDGDVNDDPGDDCGTGAITKLLTPPDLPSWIMVPFDADGNGHPGVTGTGAGSRWFPSNPVVTFGEATEAFDLGFALCATTVPELVVPDFGIMYSQFLNANTALGGFNIDTTGLTVFPPANSTTTSIRDRGLDLTVFPFPDDGLGNDDVEFYIPDIDSKVNAMFGGEDYRKRTRFRLAQFGMSLRSSSSGDLSDEDSVVTFCRLDIPELEVKKEVRCADVANDPWRETTQALPGAVIEFRITVENTGNLPLAVELSDVLQAVTAGASVTPVAGSLVATLTRPADPAQNGVINFGNALSKDPKFDRDFFNNPGTPAVEEGFLTELDGTPVCLGVFLPVDVCTNRDADPEPDPVDGDIVVITFRATVDAPAECDGQANPDIKNSVIADGDPDINGGGDGPCRFPAGDAEQIPGNEVRDEAGAIPHDPINGIDTPRENDQDYDDNVVTIDLLCRQIEVIKDVALCVTCTDDVWAAGITPDKRVCGANVGAGVLIITAGTNGTLETVLNNCPGPGDDVLLAGPPRITAGPNGRVDTVPNCGEEDADYVDELNIPDGPYPLCIEYRYRVTNGGEIEEKVTLTDLYLCTDVNAEADVDFVVCDLCPTGVTIDPLPAGQTNYYYCRVKFNTKTALENFLERDDARTDCTANDPVNVPDPECYKNCATVSAQPAALAGLEGEDDEPRNAKPFQIPPKSPDNEPNDPNSGDDPEFMPDPDGGIAQGDLCGTGGALTDEDDATICFSVCQLEVTKEVRCLEGANCTTTQGPEEGWVSDDSLQVAPDACVQYRITVENTGAIDVCALEFTDTMTCKTNFASGPTAVDIDCLFNGTPVDNCCPGSEAAFNWNGTAVKCTLSQPLEPGDTVTILFKAKLKGAADIDPACDPLNTILVRGASVCPQGQEPVWSCEDTDTEQIDILPCDINVWKDVKCGPGDDYWYAIGADNVCGNVLTAHRPIISIGLDGVWDTAPNNCGAGDDEFDASGRYITTGPDGIVNTTVFDFALAAEAVPGALLTFRIVVTNDELSSNLPRICIDDDLTCKSWLVDDSSRLTVVRGATFIDVTSCFGAAFENGVSTGNEKCFEFSDCQAMVDTGEPWLKPDGDTLEITFQVRVPPGFATVGVDPDCINHVRVEGFTDGCLPPGDVPGCTDEDQAEIDVKVPGLSCVKDVAVDLDNNGTVDLGFAEEQHFEPTSEFRLIYRYTLCNTGDLPITDLCICDDLRQKAAAAGMTIGPCALEFEDCPTAVAGEKCAHIVGVLTNNGDCLSATCEIIVTDMAQWEALAGGANECYENVASGQGNAVVDDLCLPPGFDPTVNTDQCVARVCPILKVCPPVTKARFDIWNQNEVQFSETVRCLYSWDQFLLSAVDPPNFFLRAFLQTDKGKARIDGVPHTGVPDICPDSERLPLLGVVAKVLNFSGQFSLAGMPLTGMGTEPGQIKYDVTTPPDEARPTVPDRPLGRSGGSDRVPTGDPERPPESITSPAQKVASISEKGSLLVFAKIEVKETAGGRPVQDTFIQLTNDYPADVRVQLYLVNGDPFTCNWIDNEILLTAHEPAYWGASQGSPKGVSPISVLDPNGTSDNDPLNPGGRVWRAYLLAWAVDDENHEIRWNHLTGQALIVNYLHTTAWDYNVWSFRAQAENTNNGDVLLDPLGQLDLDGVEYDFVPGTLLLDFYASGSAPFPTGTPAPTVDTDLTLWAAWKDLTQDAPARTDGERPVEGAGNSDSEPTPAPQ